MAGADLHRFVALVVGVEMGKRCQTTPTPMSALACLLKTDVQKRDHERRLLKLVELLFPKTKI